MASSDHTSKSSKCSVYVIRASSGAVKIGIAQDIKTRLRDLQVANHERLSVLYSLNVSSREIAFQIEAFLHQRYAGNALHGEWFSVNAEQLIADIRFAVVFARLIKGFSIEDETKYETYSAQKPKQSLRVGDDTLFNQALEILHTHGKMSGEQLCKELNIDEEVGGWIVVELLKYNLAHIADEGETLIFMPENYKSWKALMSTGLL